MKLAQLFPFFIIVVLLFSFGCIANNSNNKQATAKTINTLGIIKYEYTLNGKNSTEIRLLKDEQTQIGVKLTNFGKHPINNVTLQLISCISPKASNSYYNQILPKTTSYFSFTLVNSLSLASQEIKCPSRVRVYFDYYTQSYHDIAILGKSYSGEQPQTSYYSDSELLKINYEFPVAFRLINNNEISGRLVVNNIGNGFVGNPTIGENNELREIDISLPSEMQLVEVGGYPIEIEGYGGGAISGTGGTHSNTPVAKSKVSVSPLLLESNSVVPVIIENKGNYITYKIISTLLSPTQRSVITTLATGSGNPGTLYLPIKLSYSGNVNPNGVKLERIYVTIYYRYSYDLFKFNLILGSNY